ncbi:hypothetical protein FHR32_003559 [Streptosporangium album]|uniref:Serine/threonine protein kinase n=1 Tax=Streptosporangium album TaxID=47479 RepID=A0A7W7WAL0_9ACTN|nr:hypothetical protein [Streptosporangium album]MBB4939254.1 hypothetical protein [Streptosporangium album]
MITTLALSAALVFTGSPAQAPAQAPVNASAKTVSYRGMTLQVPATWMVAKEGSGLHVSTGTCSRAAVECEGFRIGGPIAVKYGHEGGQYSVNQPYEPSSGVTKCVTDKKYTTGAAKRLYSGYRYIGSKKAHYTTWEIACNTASGKPVPGSSYNQVVWYLPSSKMIVVDEFGTEGLEDILAEAHWR